MISKDEIIEKAREFDINSYSDVQRDYVFGWFLVGIYLVSDLKDYLILKGGNCLRKAYFENTRFSGDLDFSIEATLPEDLILKEFNKVCDFVQENSGIVFEKERNSVGEKKRVDPSRKVYEARLYFKDFYNNPSKMIISIKLDLTQFDKIHLPIQKRFLIHPYSDYKQCSVELRCLKLEEILASKLKCLLQRRHSSDLYDYVFSVIFNKGIDVNKLEIVKTFIKMTIFERSPGIVKGLLIDLPFQFIKAFWEKHLICPKPGIIDFEFAVEKYKESISELFGNLPIDRKHTGFYPSHFRNPIMQAGSTLTLLEVVYKGVKRLVEPYSLAYKVTQAGIGSEYFYVYDTTGGVNSPPSIKTLLPHNVQSVTNTEIKFEPRYDVEISKAGEYHKDTYFGKPFKLSRGTVTKKFKVKSTSARRGVISLSNGPTYIIECPYCMKLFRRKKYSTKLGKHRDKYKNWCFGRYGVLKDTKYQ